MEERGSIRPRRGMMLFAMIRKIDFLDIDRNSLRPRESSGNFVVDF